MGSRLGRRVVHFANLPIKLMLPSPPFDSIRESAIRSHRLAAAPAAVANLFSPSTVVGNDGGVCIGLSLWRRSLATTLVDIASGFSGVIGACALSPSSFADSDHPFKLSTQPLPQPLPLFSSSETSYLLLPPLSDLTRQDQIRDDASTSISDLRLSQPIRSPRLSLSRTPLSPPPLLTPFSSAEHRPTTRLTRS